jgi:uncharacterized protein (TIGR04255 family)
MERRPPVLLKSPLQIVAAELRFPDAVLLLEDYKKIRKGFVQEYPASDTEHGVGIELSAQGVVSQQQTLQRQVYRSIDGSHQIGLTSTSLVLEARGEGRYEGFEHFLERWLTALDVVVPVAEIDTRIRLGLRYINQLPVEDPTQGLDALAGRVNPTLLSPLGTDGFEFSVATSFQELRLESKDGKATLRHGLQIAPEGSSPPGVFVLDLDFYDDEIGTYDRERQIEQLKLFNFQLWKLFRWSLTDDEYERMQPEERK